MARPCDLGHAEDVRPERQAAVRAEARYDQVETSAVIAVQCLLWLLDIALRFIIKEIAATRLLVSY